MAHYWLKMIYQGLGTYSNILLDIFGTFKMPTKCGHLDPLFVTEMLTKYKRQNNIVLNKYFVHISKCWKPMLSKLWKVCASVFENVRSYLETISVTPSTRFGCVK